MSLPYFFLLFNSIKIVNLYSTWFDFSMQNLWFEIHGCYTLRPYRTFEYLINFI